MERPRWKTIAHDLEWEVQSGLYDALTGEDVLTISGSYGIYQPQLLAEQVSSIGVELPDELARPLLAGPDHPDYMSAYEELYTGIDMPISIHCHDWSGDLLAWPVGEGSYHRWHAAAGTLHPGCGRCMAVSHDVLRTVADDPWRQLATPDDTARCTLHPYEYAVTAWESAMPTTRGDRIYLCAECSRTWRRLRRLAAAGR